MLVLAIAKKHIFIYDMLNTYYIMAVVEYTFRCPNCRRERKVTCEDGFIGTVAIDKIKCKCGREISVIILRYIARKKGFLEKGLKYLVL